VLSIFFGRIKTTKRGKKEERKMALSDVVEKLEALREDAGTALDCTRDVEARYAKKIEKLKGIATAKDDTIAELEGTIATLEEERNAAVQSRDKAERELDAATEEIRELSRAMTEFKKVSRTVALENENAVLKEKIRVSEECARQCRAEVAMMKRTATVTTADD